MRKYAVRNLAARAGLLSLAALAIVLGCAGAWAQAPASSPIVGHLVLRVRDARENVVQIRLAERKVVLRNAAGGSVASAATGLDGRFELTAPAPGSYQICWNLGSGTAGCGTSLSVNGRPVWLGNVVVSPERPVVFGTVLTGDGRPCWINDPYFRVSAYTRVTGGGVGSIANAGGEYALIGAQPGAVQITARCEAAGATATATLSNLSVRQDISLGNHAPQIADLAAFAGGKGVTRADPGASVKMAATLKAGTAPLTSIWETGGEEGSVVTGTGDARTWALPAEPGLRSAYIMARDGNGGYAFKRLAVQTGPAIVEFSGRVIDETTSQPILSAAVTLGAGGAAATTDARGWFLLRTPERPDDRYVLNIKHPNYALLSRVADRSALGGTYPLIRAQVTTVRGDQAITLDDTGSGGPCGAPSGQRPPDVTRIAKTTVLWDGPPANAAEAERRKAIEANIPRDPGPATCERRGARISIPAGALVDANGAAVTGDVRTAMTTLNPARRSIPGDYRAVARTGQNAELLSFGALGVDITDPSGRPLRLRQGAAADITVPSFATNPTAAPANIAMWSYDEATGMWREEGQAALQATPQGPAYVGKTTHFSFLNMDVAGTDPAHATCVRFEMDPLIMAWDNLVMRAYVTYGGTGQITKETPLDTAQYHAVYRIPYDTGFPNSVRLEIRGSFQGRDLIVLSNVIVTDLRPKMTGTNLWPPYPYSECGAPVTIAPDLGVIPNYGDHDAADRPAFLSGPTGDFNPSNAQAIADQYRDAVDPTHAKTTLGAWWTANGFDTSGQGPPASFASAAYLNNNDLGFGRNMNCLKSGGKVACYVTNYGAPDQNPGNADLADPSVVGGANPANRVATVAMEYDPAATGPGVDERVQFYVYGGGVATSQQIEFADLDGFGPKPSPLLCVVCHGGSSSLTTDGKANFARFREFDLPSFRYSGGRTWDYNNTTTLSAGDLGQFARLNQMIHDAPPGTPISRLVDAWYPGGLGSGAPTDPAPPPAWANPPGWTNPRSAYAAVYGKSCRTCHIARDAGDPGGGLSFYDNPSLFFTGFAVGYVCGPPSRVMPNAIVTYKNFWSGYAAAAGPAQDYETLMHLKGTLPTATHCNQ